MTELAQSFITVPAQQRADLAGICIMINMKPLLVTVASFCRAANCALAALCHEHGFVGLGSKSVSRFEGMPEPSLRIGLAPSITRFRKAFWVFLVSSLVSFAHTRSAPHAVTVFSPLVKAKGRQGSDLTALTTQFFRLIHALSISATWVGLECDAASQRR